MDDELASSQTVPRLSNSRRRVSCARCRAMQRQLPRALLWSGYEHATDSSDVAVAATRCHWPQRYLKQAVGEANYETS